MDEATLRAQVIQMVKDDAGKLADPEDFDLAIAAALERYSKHRPGLAVVDVAGNGSHDIAIADLTGWVAEFSSVAGIEYPVDQVPEEMLDEDNYYLYEKPAGSVLRITSISPDATENVRVSFTVPRTAATVRAQDETALTSLAVSVACEMLANAYAQTGDSTLNADSVDHKSRSREYAGRAKRLRDFYNTHMGVKDGDTAPAAAVAIDLDVNYPGGGDRLTHPRKPRERR